MEPGHQIRHFSVGGGVLARIGYEQPGPFLHRNAWGVEFHFGNVPRSCPRQNGLVLPVNDLGFFQDSTLDGDQFFENFDSEPGLLVVLAYGIRSLPVVMLLPIEDFLLE